jgi:tetratricopeptide (TPR) repeat protein
MKPINIRELLVVSFLITLFSVSCKKQDDYLAAVPDESLGVPSTLNDLQLMLQQENYFNASDPGFGTLSADEYYVSDASWISSSPLEQNVYLWAKEIYPNQTDQIDDWNSSYLQVYTANTVLDVLSGIKNIGNPVNPQHDVIKGSALFFRAKAFYNLLQIFSLPYDSVTAGTQLGIPLRLSADLNIKSVRSSEQECYNQILQDLQTAVSLLPATTAHPTQPTIAAADGFLARVYLTMGNYTKAFQFADACLAGNHSLMDYNSLKLGAFPIASSLLNEDIFHCATLNYGIFGYSDAIIDSNLYHSYQSNDLRKSIFFYYYRNQWTWNGTYDVIETNIVFDGIATDEMYLIRAECYARLGNTTAAMNDLNALLVKRWKTGTFVPYTAVNADDALQQILAERKKELLFRGTRWTDLRRLNKDPRFAVTLTRRIKGVTYTLPPNDPRYTLPIPYPEIRLSGIQQNAR